MKLSKIGRVSLVSAALAGLVLACASPASAVDRPLDPPTFHQATCAATAYVEIPAGDVQHQYDFDIYIAEQWGGPVIEQMPQPREYSVRGWLGDAAGKQLDWREWLFTVTVPDCRTATVAPRKALTVPTPKVTPKAPPRVTRRPVTASTPARVVTTHRGVPAVDQPVKQAHQLHGVPWIAVRIIWP